LPGESRTSAKWQMSLLSLRSSISLEGILVMTCTSKSDLFQRFPKPCHALGDDLYWASQIDAWRKEAEEQFDVLDSNLMSILTVLEKMKKERDIERGYVSDLQIEKSELKKEIGQTRKERDEARQESADGFAKFQELQLELREANKKLSEIKNLIGDYHTKEGFDFNFLRTLEKIEKILEESP